eukprot:356091-Chlamydomonas_euryale.AAC.3
MLRCRFAIRRFSRRALRRQMRREGGGTRAWNAVHGPHLTAPAAAAVANAESLANAAAKAAAGALRPSRGSARAAVRE